LGFTKTLYFSRINNGSIVVKPDSKQLPPPALKRKAFKMPAVYDDNFGFWHIDGQEEQAFFDHVQRRSLQRTCERCERRAWLMPPKTICASCATALEYGASDSMSQY
jgi:hypothetical protein